MYGRTAHPHQYLGLLTVSLHGANTSVTIKGSTPITTFEFLKENYKKIKIKIHSFRTNALYNVFLCSGLGTGEVTRGPAIVHCPCTVCSGLLVRPHSPQWPPLSQHACTSSVDRVRLLPSASVLAPSSTGLFPHGRWSGSVTLYFTLHDNVIPDPAFSAMMPSCARASSVSGAVAATFHSPLFAAVRLKLRKRSIVSVVRRHWKLE